MGGARGSRDLRQPVRGAGHLPTHRPPEDPRRSRRARRAQGGHVSTSAPAPTAGSWSSLAGATRRSARTPGADPSWSRSVWRWSAGWTCCWRRRGACAGSFYVRAHRVTYRRGRSPPILRTPARGSTGSGGSKTRRHLVGSSPRASSIVASAGSSCGSRCFRRSWRACSGCRWSSSPSIGSWAGTRGPAGHSPTPTPRRGRTGCCLLSVRRQWLSG